MKLTDVFNAQAVAANFTEAASNAIPYLGTGLFPAQKKAGLDLKWIKGHRGLPVSLAPSAFDVKSGFRDRIGVQVAETEMPFFREGMIVKERDEQEIMRVQDSNDPYAQQVLDSIFDDTRNLIDGANVVPERMIMQLLCPIGGKIGVEIAAKGVNYTYNYDPKGDWKAKHYMAIASEADKWTASDTCDPLDDLENAIDAQEAESGNRPATALMSLNTFKLLKNSAKMRSAILAQNVTANVNMTTKRVTDYIKEEYNIDIIVYTKKYKDENGVEKNFFADNGVMLMPAGALGSTWYGTTPEESRGGQGGGTVSLVNTGVAVCVYTTLNPVNTVTTASEIVLPSFERMDECYFIEVA